MKKLNYDFKISAKKYIDLQEVLMEEFCKLEKEEMEESKELYYNKPNQDTAKIYQQDKKNYKLKKQSYTFHEFLVQELVRDNISTFILILSYCFNDEEPNYDKALDFFDKYINQDKGKTKKTTHKDIVLLILDILEDSGQMINSDLLRTTINKIYTTLDNNIDKIEDMTNEDAQDLVNQYIENDNIIINE